MVTRNGGRAVLPTVGMTFASQGMIALDQTALGLAGTTTGLSSAAPRIMIAPGLESPGHPVPVSIGTPTVQEAGPISQRAFPEIPITGRIQTVPDAMPPGRTGHRGLAVTVTSAPMTGAPVVVIATPVLRVLSAVPAIARILTVPIDFRLINPVLTATGVIAAMATIVGVGKRVAAELPGIASGLPALPGSIGMSVGMTGPVFQPIGTETILPVIGLVGAKVGMSAPVMVNPPALPVSVGMIVRGTPIGSVTQKRTGHPAFRVVRAGATAPTNQRLNE
jgi:hypothetical protein